MNVGFDYQVANVVLSGTVTPSGTPWGSPWGSPWSPLARINAIWRASKGTGTAISPRFYVSTKQAVQWYRTDFRVEPGINL
jgi:hypothetical protein